MQGSNNGQGNQNGQKQSSLSWSQPPQSAGGAGGAKPVSQVAPSPVVQSKISAPQPVKNNAAGNANNNNKAKQQSGGGGRTAGVFAAGIIIGLIIGWGWFSLRGDNTKVADNSSAGEVTSSQQGSSVEENTETGSATSGASSASGASTVSSSSSAGEGSASSGAVSTGGLTVATQSAGMSVVVSDVSVSVPTWVVIFDSNSGKPGNALGAALFFPGQKSGTVELLRATVAGQTYLAGEYVDNGDHIFSKQKDTQVNTVTGSQMLVQFSVR